MMKFKDILRESKSQTICLYRGDSTSVEKFLRNKTEGTANFGKGIYLTDSPEVAKMYSYKGGSSVLFNGGSVFSFSSVGTGIATGEEKDKLVKEYLTFLALSYKPSIEDRGAALWYIASKYQENNPADWERRLVQAQQEYDSNKERYSIENISGNLCIVDASKYSGIVSVFDVPISIISKCVNAEEKVSPEVLSIMQASVFNTFSKPEAETISARLKLLVSNPKRVDAKMHYTDNGNFEVEELSSFRFLFLLVSEIKPKVFSDDLQRRLSAAGYVGIHFDGSRDDYRKIEHNNYVFFNIPMINKYRKTAQQ